MIKPVAKEKPTQIQDLNKEKVIDKREEKVNFQSHTKSQKHDFLLSAKNLYLTYSKCNLLLSEILSQLKSILSSYIVKEYLLVREYHVDGGPYVHVDLKLLKKQKYLQKPF